MRSEDEGRKTMKGSIIAFDPCPHCENHDMCSKCELTFRRSGVIANPCEWISVEERLPEENGYYLVYTKYGYIEVERYKTWDDDDLDGGYWWEFEGLVTHWMPLPEAPKGGAVNE